MLMLTRACKRQSVRALNDLRKEGDELREAVKRGR